MAYDFVGMLVPKPIFYGGLVWLFQSLLVGGQPSATEFCLDLPNNYAGHVLTYFSWFLYNWWKGTHLHYRAAEIRETGVTACFSGQSRHPNFRLITNRYVRGKRGSDAAMCSTRTQFETRGDFLFFLLISISVNWCCMIQTDVGE